MHHFDGYRVQHNTSRGPGRGGVPFHQDVINRRLDRIMEEAFQAIWDASGREKVSLRTATYIVACKRVLEARQLRGLYP